MSDLNTLLHYGTVKVRPYGSAPMPFMELSAMADVNSSREAGRTHDCRPALAL